MIIYNFNKKCTYLIERNFYNIVQEIKTIIYIKYNKTYMVYRYTGVLQIHINYDVVM